MSPSPGPLSNLARNLRYVASQFIITANTIRGIWLLGPFLSAPFEWLSTFFGWCSEETYRADARLESLEIDEFLSNPSGWALKRIGANWWERSIFRDHFIGWILYRFGANLSEALIFEYSPILFIQLKVRQWWPFLQDLLNDPIWFVLHKLGFSFWEGQMFRGHVIAWILYRFGAPLPLALGFEVSPISWIKLEIGQHWPFLNKLLFDPTGWIRDILEINLGLGVGFFLDPAPRVWEWLIEGLERFLILELEWLIGFIGRIASEVWDRKET